MDATLGSALAAAFVALVGLIGIVLKLRPERTNLTLTASQKAIKILLESMNEIAEQLEEARGTIDELQRKLVAALARCSELEAALEAERARWQQPVATAALEAQIRRLSAQLEEAGIRQASA